MFRRACGSESNRFNFDKRFRALVDTKLIIVLPDADHASESRFKQPFKPAFKPALEPAETPAQTDPITRIYREEQIPPYPPAGGEGGSLDCLEEDRDLVATGEPHAVVAGFQKLLAERKKTTFPRRWHRQNLAKARELLAHHPRDKILACARWCLTEAKAAPTVDHLKHVERLWNTWVGVTGGGEQARPMSRRERIQSAARVLVRPAGGEPFETDGRAFGWDETSRVLTLDGREYSPGEVEPLEVAV